MPHPLQLLWDPKEAIKKHPQLQKVERSMSRWGNCLFMFYWFSWQSGTLFFRWWEPSPKRGGTSHEISLNCACFVIFIYMCCTWRQSAYFVVSFRSPSEIILPWCLIISTKSPPFFLPILILKPKVSLTFILSQRQTPDLALFTNIGINWALHTKKSFGSSSKKEKKRRHFALSVRQPPLPSDGQFFNTPF